MPAESVDLTDDDSIAALARWVGAVDHVLSTASARARDKIGDLDRDAVWRSFDTKLIGPLALTRALRNQINAEGSILTFPGCRGVRDRGRHARGRNHQGAADTLTRSLAIELAPITFDGSPTGRCPTQITLSHRGRAARVQPGTSRDVPRGATSAGLCASFSLLREAVALTPTRYATTPDEIQAPTRRAIGPTSLLHLRTCGRNAVAAALHVAPGPHGTLSDDDGLVRTGDLSRVRRGASR